MTARILIADDTPDHVKQLEAKLLVEYYEVVTANDGSSVLPLTHEQHPDIIFLNFRMPGMDGYEVCQRLKADEATAHIPVVIMTACDEVGDRVRGLEAGADDFVTKPVNDVALFARIRALVRMKRASDEWRAREATAVELGVIDAAGNSIDEKAPGSVLLATDGMWDDDAVMETLKAQGHKIDLADDDGTAMSMAAEGDYDIVMISDGDRSSDALRLCSQLRYQPETRHGPILLLVPEGAEERLAKGLELGINDYLVYPIEQVELIARTWSQIRRKRYEDGLREIYVASVNAGMTNLQTDYVSSSSGHNGKASHKTTSATLPSATSPARVWSTPSKNEGCAGTKRKDKQFSPLLFFALLIGGLILIGFALNFLYTGISHSIGVSWEAASDISALVLFACIGVFFAVRRYVKRLDGEESRKDF
jgi:two-component system, cell cycle response regulator